MRHLVFLLSLILLLGCSQQEGVRHYQKEYKPVLSSINIIDHNGFSETIGSGDRLDQYKNVNFLTLQPYQKVLRVFSRDPNGDIRAIITNYYPNGQPKQYLDVVNNRANGYYREWHPNGVLKVESYVIGGEPDIDTAAENSWLFEGTCYAWNEDGCLLAEIPYSHGELEGCSLYYHTNGSIWKKVPSYKGKAEGAIEIYLDDGSLFQTVTYAEGERHGSAKRYWNNNQLAVDEEYSKGLLTTGKYYDRSNKLISSIQSGTGRRVLFGKNSISEIHEYQNGIQAGEIKVYGDDEELVRNFHLINGVKNGTQTEFYSTKESKGGIQRPKLSIGWVDGKIQGVVKTWYPSGIQESQREMSGNTKNGILTGWYKDGSVMVIEEYDHDILINGEYYIRGESMPISEIKNGNGIATLFDANGNLTQKVSYFNSKPQE